MFLFKCFYFNWGSHHEKISLFNSNNLSEDGSLLWKLADYGVNQNISSASWSTTASSLRGRNNETFAFNCPSTGNLGSVWGTETYTDDSSICSAAVHAGLIHIATGGTVTIKILPGLAAYSASNQNGVDSKSWGSWSGSFVFYSNN